MIDRRGAILADDIADDIGIELFHGLSTPESREQIFEYGYRTEAGRRISSTGTGTGLTVARAIIENHGGRVWVVPNEPAGTGTRIAIELPMLRRA